MYVFRYDGSGLLRAHMRQAARAGFVVTALNPDLTEPMTIVSGIDDAAGNLESLGGRSLLWVKSEHDRVIDYRHWGGAGATRYRS
jgi:hypothetical protein